MKERPILFQPDLVRAIREGRKTETRRLVKPQPRRGRLGNGALIIRVGNDQIGDLYHVWEPKPGRVIPLTGGMMAWHWMAYCPFGSPGDRLWVRTSWATGKNLDDKSPSAIGEMALNAGYATPWAPVWDKAGGYNHAAPLPTAERDWGGRGRWRSSLHMPRWASRDTLVVEGVRLERLQQITPEGILAEGVGSEEDTPTELLDQWVRLWDSINNKKAPWSDDPWVWVVRFRRR